MDTETRLERGGDALKFERTGRVNRRDSRLVAQSARNSRKEKKGRGKEEKEEELREEGTVEGNSAPRLKPHTPLPSP